MANAIQIEAASAFSAKRGHVKNGNLAEASNSHFYMSSICRSYAHNVHTICHSTAISSTKRKPGLPLPSCQSGMLCSDVAFTLM